MQRGQAAGGSGLAALGLARVARPCRQLQAAVHNCSDLLAPLGSLCQPCCSWAAAAALARALSSPPHHPALHPRPALPITLAQPPNFQFHDPQGPIYTSPRFLPPAKVGGPARGAPGCMAGAWAEAAAGEGVSRPAASLAPPPLVCCAASTRPPLLLASPPPLLCTAPATGHQVQADGRDCEPRRVPARVHRQPRHHRAALARHGQRHHPGAGSLCLCAGVGA